MITKYHFNDLLEFTLNVSFPATALFSEPSNIIYKKLENYKITEIKTQTRELQNYRITELQNYRITELQRNELQNYRITELQ